MKRPFTQIEDISLENGPAKRRRLYPVGDSQPAWAKHAGSVVKGAAQ